MHKNILFLHTKMNKFKQHIVNVKPAGYTNKQYFDFTQVEFELTICRWKW